LPSQISTNVTIDSLTCSAQGSCWAEAVPLQTSGLLHSTDDGISWQLVPLPHLNPGPGLTVTCVDSERCLIHEQTRWFRTSDGGRTWATSLMKGVDAFTPTCNATGVCIAAGVTPFEGPPTVILSRDAGRSWIVQLLPVPMLAGPQAAGTS
jgi:photosystem II stability/assembly factor-like uncharacterized protein